MLKVVKFDVLDTYSLAMQQSGIPLVHELELFNDGTDPIKELSIELSFSGDLGTPIQVKATEPLRGGDLYLPLRMTDDTIKSIRGQQEKRTFKYPLAIHEVQRIAEDETVSLYCSISSENGELWREERFIRLLAYNTYRFPIRNEFGKLVLEQPFVDSAEVYSCFVTPGHPVITQLHKGISKQLSSLGFDGSTEGYQKNNPDRVKEMIKGVYEYIGKSLDIGYSNPPPGYFNGRQRIRLPDQVLQNGMGTCADLAPFAASCLELIGLDPVLVVESDHVVQGAFLNPGTARSMNSLELDVGVVRKLIEADELLLFDSSTYAQSPQPPFIIALNNAVRSLEKFNYMINIRSARINGYLPFPIRMAPMTDMPTGEIRGLIKGILEGAAGGQTKELEDTQPKSPVNNIIGNRFRSWKERLLDLSKGGDRLLNIDIQNGSGHIAIGLASLFSKLLYDFGESARAKVEEFKMNNNDCIDDEHTAINQQAEYFDSLSQHISDKPDVLRGVRFILTNQYSVKAYAEELRRFLGDFIVDRLVSIIEGSPDYSRYAYQLIDEAIDAGSSETMYIQLVDDYLGELENRISQRKEFTLLPSKEYSNEEGMLLGMTEDFGNNILRVNPRLNYPRISSQKWQFDLAKRLAREAQAAEEQTGFSPLYLALGLLQWREQEGVDEATGGPALSSPLLAPLILYPIELRIDSREQVVKLIHTSGSPVGNVTLAETLRNEFGIDLDILNDLPEDNHGVDLNEVLRVVAKAIEAKPGWHVIRSAVISQFSFGNFLLWRDLHDNEETLLQSEAVRQIASAGRDRLKDSFPDRPQLNLDQLSARRLSLVYPTDSSQLEAVNAAINGRSFVLQGPPGTGKSQTITNIIASAMDAGKTVLFVAEKQGALDVVFSKLADAGLAPFCLPLEVSATNSKLVVDSLGQALQHRCRHPEQWEKHCHELDRFHQQLADHHQALHRKQDIGFSLYEMIDARLQTGVAIELPNSLNLDALKAGQFEEHQQQIRDLCRQRDFQDDLEANPWQFTRLSFFNFDVQSRVQTLLPECRSLVVGLIEHLQEMQNQGLSAPELSWELAESLCTILQRHPEQRVPLVVSEPQRWQPFRQQAEQWLINSQSAIETRKGLLQRWDASITDQDVTHLVQSLEGALRSFIVVRWIRGFLLRRRMQSLRRGGSQSLRQILEDLRSIQSLQQDTKERDFNRQQLQHLLPGWDGDQNSLQAALNSWAAVADLAEEDARFQPLLKQLPSLAPEICARLVEVFKHAATHLSQFAVSVQSPPLPLNEHRKVPLQDLYEWLQNLDDNQAQLQGWASWIRAESEFRGGELGPLLDWSQANNVAWDQLEMTYRTGVMQHWFQRCFNAEQNLTNFLSEAHEWTQQAFRSLDNELLVLNQQRIQAKLVNQIPHGTFNLGGSEFTTLNVELNKQNRWLPVRTLFRRIPNLLPRLKPCILASPSSVAQFLPADGHRFDIVIFDEASQMHTHKAIGAMGRGKQVIVVGDDKQLSPTKERGKKKSTSDDILVDSIYATQLPSVLSESLAYGLPELSLRWHYRSQHQSLIEFSNQHYYANSLCIFPSPKRIDPELGIHYHFIQDGRLRKESRYSTQVNRQEATELTHFLLSQLVKYDPNNDDHPSFGIVTFSQNQCDVIKELLDQAQNQAPWLTSWLPDKSSGSSKNSKRLFYKKLEEVQGDECDFMLFSTTFAPTDDGKFAITFGALGEAGGERRLNVAITRARKALHIFSSIDPEKIQYKNNQNKILPNGTRDFKSFLEVCRSRPEGTFRPERTNDFDGELQQQIYDALVEAGYRVDCKVGSAGYRIDLAVVDPDDPTVYRIGIEADGQSYASAPTVRDRDRVRHKSLTDMGWTLHRVWSVAWLLNKQREKQRLLEAVRKAMQSPSIGENNNQLVDSGSAPGTRLKANDSSHPEHGHGKDVIEEHSSSSAKSIPDDHQDPKPRHPGRHYQTVRLEPVSDDFSAFYRDQAPALIQDRLLILLASEAPITFADATRRVASCWGGKNLTQRAQNRLLEVVNPLQQSEQLFLDEDRVLWLSELQRDMWTGFRRPPLAGRSLDSVPPVEIRAALVMLTQESLSIDSDSLLREASRNLTGAPNFTEQRRQLLQKQLDCLLNSGLLELRDGRIFPTQAS